MGVCGRGAMRDDVHDRSVDASAPPSTPGRRGTFGERRPNAGAGSKDRKDGDPEPQRAVRSVAGGDASPWRASPGQLAPGVSETERCVGSGQNPQEHRQPSAQERWNRTAARLQPNSVAKSHAVAPKRTSGPPSCQEKNGSVLCHSGSTVTFRIAATRPAS